MLKTIINTIIRTTAGYILLLFLTRFMGRKMISQMTFLDFVVGITVGSVTANIALGPNKQAILGASTLIILAILTIATSILRLKSFKFRKLVNSEPIVIIKNGKIIDKNMNKMRLTINDLTMKLREKNIFNISNVEFAIMETDGKLSVLPKSQQKPLTPSDLSLDTKYTGLTKDIIIDGKIMTENLAKTNLDKKWLINQLKKEKIQDITKVFYAGLDTEGNLYTSIKDTEKTTEPEGKYGIE